MSKLLTLCVCEMIFYVHWESLNVPLHMSICFSMCELNVPVNLSGPWLVNCTREMSVNVEVKGHLSAFNRAFGTGICLFCANWAWIWAEKVLFEHESCIFGSNMCPWVWESGRVYDSLGRIILGYFFKRSNPLGLRPRRICIWARVIAGDRLGLQPAFICKTKC